MAKTAGLLVITAALGVVAYKYTGFKNIFKGNFGELWSYLDYLYTFLKYFYFKQGKLF